MALAAPVEVGSRVPRGLAKFEGAFRALAGQALASEVWDAGCREQVRREVCVLLARSGSASARALLSPFILCQSVLVGFKVPQPEGRLHPDLKTCGVAHVCE